MPIFCPSPELLLRWDCRRNVPCPRLMVTDMTMGQNRTTSAPQSPKTRIAHHPNSPDPGDMLFWMRLSQCHTLPHVVQFSSVDDLVDKVQGMDPDLVRSRMAASHASQSKESRLRYAAMSDWLERASRVPPREAGQEYSERMRHIYGDMPRHRVCPAEMHTPIRGAVCPRYVPR
eukprot:NODE_4059_length_701_cov_29.079755_g3433_i0.p1 GENE.NODE_4059_length_701_cov_29.079755_g3433_i0~~NODE_4059_length_701_cov_29.079755_g3433_i0.p1  ORF type:complete len:192 (-),score=27.17 NODE_4059_length_701_cov_29.079755_g3433_i0:124-645(-)